MGQTLRCLPYMGQGINMDKVHYSSKTDEWETPDDLFAKLDAEFHFTLDPCATKDNARCAKYYTKEDDGLIQSWLGNVVFMNPPYGSQLKLWAKKAFEESSHATVVCLVPSRTDTSYWHDYFMKADEIRYIRGRLKFKGGRSCAPFPPAIVIFNGRVD